MTNPKYDIALAVGRFQPYHNSHHNLLTYALSLGKEVSVILGSAHSAPTPKNPFTPKAREQMIRECFTDEENKRISFYSVRDYPYNENKWIAEIQNIARSIQEEKFDLPEGSDCLHSIKLAEAKICLVGYQKDGTSYYLKSFPQWEFEEFYNNSKESRIINATDIRELYLNTGVTDTASKQKKKEIIRNLVPKPVSIFLDNFSSTEDFKKLVKEHEYNKIYKENSKFVNLPYAATFITTDAIVTCKGHILVVRRGVNPGKDMIALPGGFLAEGYRIEDNAIKELKEETRILLDAVLLKNLIKDSHVFDDVNRSLRGRVVTHAFYIPITIKIDNGLPLVRGGDDASKCFWLPIADLGLYEDQFFEDHIHIARHFLEVE